MRVYAEVKFLASTKESFTSKDGEYVEFFKNDVRTDSGVLTFNSKADYTECEGKDGVAEIEATEKDDGKGFKMTLKGFKEGIKIGNLEDEA